MSKPSRREKRRNRHGVEITASLDTHPDLLRVLNETTHEDIDADDAASDLDRRLFEAHPGTQEYMRDPLPGEGRAATPPGHFVEAVHVRQVFPGARVRHFLVKRIEGPLH